MIALGCSKDQVTIAGVKPYRWSEWVVAVGVGLEPCPIERRAVGCERKPCTRFSAYIKPERGIRRTGNATRAALPTARGTTARPQAGTRKTANGKRHEGRIANGSRHDGETASRSPKDGKRETPRRPHCQRLAAGRRDRKPERGWAVSAFWVGSFFWGWFLGGFQLLLLSSCCCLLFFIDCCCVSGAVGSCEEGRTRDGEGRAGRTASNADRTDYKQRRFFFFGWFSGVVVYSVDCVGRMFVFLIGCVISTPVILNGGYNYKKSGSRKNRAPPFWGL